MLRHVPPPEFTGMNKYSGFTLIEVLVAVVIMALGLLGLAALQGGGVKFNQSAYNRSQATHLAYELADRMRANSSPAAIASYLDVDGGGMDYLQSPQPPGPSSPNCKTTACSAGEMAAADINQWRAAISATLPKGCGSIMLGPATGNTNGCGGTYSAAVKASAGIYTITINWDDDKDGDIDGNDPNFMMSFQL
jgi:type IV pilus assembly protein PilV